MTQRVLGKIFVLSVNPQCQPRGHPLETSNGLWCLWPYWDGLEQHLAHTSTNVPDLHRTSEFSVKNPIISSSKLTLKAEFNRLMDSTMVHRESRRTSVKANLNKFWDAQGNTSSWASQEMPECRNDHRSKRGSKLKRSEAKRCFGVMVFYVLTKCILPQMISRFIVSKNWHMILTCVLD